MEQSEWRPLQECVALQYGADLSYNPVNPVLQWNDVALEAALIDSKRQEIIGEFQNRDQGGVTRTARAMALVSIAIHDVVVAFVGKHKPYLLTKEDLKRYLPRPENRDIHAAVSSAAYNLLRFLYPRQRVSAIYTGGNQYTVFDKGAHFEQAYLDVEDRLRREPRIGPSVTFGYNVAVLVYNRRLDDGSNERRGYRYNCVNGVWREDLLDPCQNPLDPHWGFVQPFLLKDQAEVDHIAGNAAQPPFGYDGPVPTPEVTQGSDRFDINNEEYMRDVHEVMDLVKQTIEGEDDTPRKNASFWSYDEGRGTPIRLYNHVVRAVMLKEEFRGKLDVADQAHWLLYTNLVMADATIIAWRLKFFYRLWRPIHAVQLGVLRRPATVLNRCGRPCRLPENPQEFWKPFGKRPPYPAVDFCTPPFPSFVSGHSTIGRALFHALRRLVGSDECTFALTSEELPRSTFIYNSFTAAANAIDESRVQLGVHFRMDVRNGSAAGKALEDLVHDRLDGAPIIVDEAEFAEAAATEGIREPEREGVPFTVEDYRGNVAPEQGDIPGYGDQPLDEQDTNGSSRSVGASPGS